MAEASDTLPHDQSQADPHIAWGEEAGRLRASAKAEPDPATADRIVGQATEVMARIASTPATTVPGAMVQLRDVEKWMAQDGHQDTDLAAVRSVLAVLDRLHPAGGSAPDPHLAWARQLEEHRGRLDELPQEDGPVRKAHFAEDRRIEGLILTTPAATIAGALAQLRTTRDLIEDAGSSFADDRELVALGHILATLQQLTGRALA